MKFDDLKSHARLFSEYTELRVQNDSFMTVAALNGDLINNVQARKAGVCARSFKDGVWGFASSPEQTNIPNFNQEFLESRQTEPKGILLHRTRLMPTPIFQEQI